MTNNTNNKHINAISTPDLSETNNVTLKLDLKTEVTPDKVVSIGEETIVPSIVNLNPIINSMADAQGHEPGSWNWILAGMAPFSGSSGEQASYGWRHTHRLTPDYIRAVLANYGHRRSYYLNAPFRQFNYEAAGRPHGWEPEAVNDSPDGSTNYFTSKGIVRVTGPDAEHLWLTPLFALIDDPNPILVETGLGNKLPSNLVAKFLATLLVSSAVGMVRDNRNPEGVQPYPWTYGDRATGRLLHTIVEGHKRGCLLAEDVPTAALYIRDIALTFYEKSPGIHTFGAPREGRFPMGLFNGLHWIVPVCYDAANILRENGLTSWADRYMTLVARWSQWMVDMNEVLPLDCFRADRLFLDPTWVNEQGPAESIKQFIRPEDFLLTFDFTPWAFRAVDIAKKISGDNNLRQARDTIANSYATSHPKWLVGADGEYVS